VRVRASEDLIETVVENVLENAVSFTPAEGTITVTLRRHKKAAHLVVEDSGPGVPPDRLPRIFQRYFTERPAEPDGEGVVEPHFGIGLWIVQQNVEAVGGHVEAGNRPEGGLRVRIRLPLAR
jgi:two-component system sensor histidine kinase ChvG